MPPLGSKVAPTCTLRKQQGGGEGNGGASDLPHPTRWCKESKYWKARALHAESRCEDYMVRNEDLSEVMAATIRLNAFDGAVGRTLGAAMVGTAEEQAMGKTGAHLSKPTKRTNINWQTGDITANKAWVKNTLTAREAAEAATKAKKELTRSFLACRSQNDQNKPCLCAPNECAYTKYHYCQTCDDRQELKCVQLSVCGKKKCKEHRANEKSKEKEIRQSSRIASMPTKNQNRRKRRERGLPYHYHDQSHMLQPCSNRKQSPMAEIQRKGENNK